MRPWVLAIAPSLACPVACFGGPGQAVAIDPRAHDLIEPEGTGPMSVIVLPEDSVEPLLNDVRSATTSLDVAIYLLTPSPLFTELRRAASSGVHVRVLLNRELPTGEASSAWAYSELVSAGAFVRYASEHFAFMHAKYVVCDRKVLWVMTMNGTRKALENREALVRDANMSDVNVASGVFDGDFTEAGPEPIATGPPATSNTLVLAPDNAASAVTSAIGKANRSLDIESESIGDDDVTSALVAAHARGVVVRVVLPAGQESPRQRTAVANLRAEGVTVRYVVSPYIHAKWVVVDGRVAYVGSTNFTFTSLRLNRELGIFLTDPAAVDRIERAFRADF